MTVESQEISGRVSNSSMAAREFQTWLNVQDQSQWPDDLKRKAVFALCTLKVMDNPSHQHEQVQQLDRADLQSFAAAYAEWRG